jgi:hypothetical protein
MSVSAARKFDPAMRSSVASLAVDNLIELRIETRVTWGRASYRDERNAASVTSYCRLSSRLEPLDWIPVGIFYLDLWADGASLHPIAKLHARVL